MEADAQNPVIQNNNQELLGPAVDWLGIVVAFIVSGWIWATAVIPSILIWLIELFAIILGYDWQSWYRPLSVLVQAFLTFGVLLPLYYFWPWSRPRYKGVFLMWLWASSGMFLLIPVHFVHFFRADLAAILQTIIMLLLSFMLYRRFPTQNYASLPHWWWPALLVAPIAGLGWFLWGAFGTWIDLLLVLISAAAFGTFSGLLIDRTLMPAIQNHSMGEGWDITLGGIATANGLLMIGMAYGWVGQRILILAGLWFSGWLIICLFRWGGVKTAILLITLLLAIPLTAVDNDELVLTVFGDPLLQWASYSVGITAGITIFFGILLFIFRRQLTPDLLKAPLLKGGTAVVWIIGLGLFFIFGQPGTHGDRVFIILKTQADLSTAVSMPNYSERRTFAYETLVDHANEEQASLRRLLDRLPIEYTPYYLVNAIEVEAGPLLRLYLARRPEVDRVIDSPVLRPLPAELDTVTGSASAPTEPQWNLTQIGATRVWDELGVRGKGVLVGQSDSGAEWLHPELMDSYRGRDGNHSGNWLDPYENRPVPFDHGGHGTHTLGSVLGNSVGVAPDAEWIGCANLDRNLGNPAVYLDCMQFMLAPFPHGGDPFVDGEPAQGAHVLNNSWGCPPLEGCDPTSLQDAVLALRQAGVFVVVSAGNDGEVGCETVNSPLAIYDAVFSVGASDERGAVSSFSSRGPVTVDGSGRVKPDILAPGVDVLSAFPNGSYDYASGTSMAGPHVAGVVALVWSANPDLIGQIDETERILRDTAVAYQPSLASDPCAQDNPENVVGAGTVSAYDAVLEALNR